MRHDVLANGTSSALANWLLDRRGQFVNRGRLLPLQLKYGAFWFERLLALQDGLEQIGSREPDTAFILGFWRSGTTLLHNLLYAGWQCRTPLSWECFRPATFKLQPPPRVEAVRRRPMDGGLIRSSGPQEDEFATLLLGEPSLYRGFLDPNCCTMLAETVLNVTATAYPRWARFVRSASDPDKVTLLKSPSHVFRAEAITTLFPSRREVWIGRSFRSVFASNFAMWSAMSRLHSLTRFSPDLMEGFIVNLAEAYLAVLQRLLDRHGYVRRDCRPPQVAPSTLSPMSLRGSRLT